MNPDQAQVSSPRGPLVDAAELVRCASCGVMDAPFHKPKCPYRPAQRSASPAAAPLPLTCESCDGPTNTLYSIARFRKDRKGKLVRSVASRVCGPCYYWRYEWDERKQPHDLDSVSA